MKNLIKMAEDFVDLSESKGKVIKNNNEILKEISELKDFDDRVELAREHFDELGEGSSRTIFQMSDSLVLKVAHNEKGLAQNGTEMSIHSPCLNNVLAADPEAKWVIVRFSEKCSEDDFEDIIGFSFDTVMKALFYFGNNENHDDKPNEYEEIIKIPLFKCLSKLVMEKQLQIGDIAKTSSWGIIDGKIILRDFGLTKDVFAEFYDGDSDNNTSTL